MPAFTLFPNPCRAHNPLTLPPLQEEAARQIHAIDEAARQEQMLDEEEEALAHAWATDLIRRRREAAAAAAIAEQEQPQPVLNHVGGETQAQIEARVRREARAEWHRTDEYWILDDTLGQAREQADRAAGVSGDVEWRSVSMSDEYDDDDGADSDSDNDNDGDGDGDGENIPPYENGNAAIWGAGENARNGGGEESSG